MSTVAYTYNGRSLHEVEFINAKGETVAVETFTPDEVRRVDLGRVMLYYNDLETAS